MLIASPVELRWFISYVFISIKSVLYWNIHLSAWVFYIIKSVVVLCFSETNKDWDEQQLKDVVEKKHGAENKKKMETTIVSHSYNKKIY